MTNHPITPPPEMWQKYWDELRSQTQIVGAEKAWEQLITLVYQAGADQQLEADCEWLTDQGLHLDGSYLYSAMRPKPPSEAEQALSLVPEPGGISMKRTYSPNELLIIRRALERLQKLETLPND